MPKNWKTVIVDDERLARNKMRSMLSAHPQIEVVGEASSVGNAINVIEETKPELIFLDIQMPGETGFELLHKLSEPLKIIFVTAFDQYAIRAFEVNALDYLLKPVTSGRLTQAIEKLSAPIENEQSLSVAQPLQTLNYDDVLFLNTGREMRFVRVNTIKFIQASDIYSKVFLTNGKMALVSKSLNDWMQRLPEKYFTRIHRSMIVNIEWVERLESWFNNSYQVYLKGIEEPFTMSRRYAAQLKERMHL